MPLLYLSRFRSFLSFLYKTMSRNNKCFTLFIPKRQQSVGNTLIQNAELLDIDIAEFLEDVDVLNSKSDFTDIEQDFVLHLFRKIENKALCFFERYEIENRFVHE